MKIRPLADRVLVQRLEAETKTAGGIVLPDTAKEKPLRKMQVKKGDTVLFTSYAGTDVKIEGKEHLIMNESDILAVIEK